MDGFCRQIIWSQFGASIDALDKAIGFCPEEVWGDPTKSPESWHEFWYLVYHTLFWLDFHLTPSKEEFAPPQPFTLSELDPEGLLPERVYSKAEMHGYLRHCRHKCQTTIEALTDESARRTSTFPWVEMGFAELLLYNLRHVQHHTGQLHLILRQKIDDAPRWVFRANP